MASSAEAALERADLIHGVEAIASFLAVRKRTAQHWIETQDDLPVFRVGRSICARRADLNAWLARGRSAGQQTALPRATPCHPGGAITGPMLDAAELVHRQLRGADWDDPRACLERIIGAALAVAPQPKEKTRGKR